MFNALWLSGMLVRLLFAALAFMLFAAPAGAQANLSLDDIMQKYVAALGGREKWQQLQTAKFTGVLANRGVEYPMTILQAKPNLCRLEFIDDGKKQIAAYDGEAAWEAGEQQNFEKKSIRDGRMRSFIEMLAISIDALIDFETKGHRLKLLGPEKVDSGMAYKLEATFASGRTEHWFMDAKSFLPIKRSFVYSHGETPAVQAFFYFDYKPVAGRMMPHFLERATLHYVWGYEIKQVEINPAGDDAKFKTP